MKSECKLLFIVVLFNLALVLIFYLLISDAESKGTSSLGLSTSYIQEDNPYYKTEHKFRPTITFTHTIDFKKLKIGYSTNRFDNLFFGEKKQEIKFNNGLKGINKQKLVYDSFMIGRQFERWLIMPFIANAKLDNKTYMNNSLLSHKVNHVWLYGLNVNYFFSKQYSVSFSYILPNNEIYLDNGFVTGISINF